MRSTRRASGSRGTRCRRGPSSAPFCCFFFQAEDGIRDYKVTGVQTCALPILRVGRPAPRPPLPLAGRVARRSGAKRREASGGGGGVIVRGRATISIATPTPNPPPQIGRASGRGRGEISGGAVSLKKKKKKRG